MRRLTLTLLLLTLFCLSCNSVQKQPIFYVSVHMPISSAEIVSSSLIMQVTDELTGESHYVRRIPLFSSADIIDGEVVPSKNPTRCQLKLVIDSHTNAKLQEALYYNKGVRACVLVDGFIAGFTAFIPSEDNTAVITKEALWNPTEAQLIVDKIPHNNDINGISNLRPWKKR